jgi:hypothetical protein
MSKRSLRHRWNETLIQQLPWLPYKHLCKSSSYPILQLGIDLKAAADQLKLRNRSSISWTAACELFNRYVTRTLEDIREFELGHHDSAFAKRETYFISFVNSARHICSGNFAAMSMHSRQKISEYGGQFIHDGCTVLHKMVLSVRMYVLSLLTEKITGGMLLLIRITRDYSTR